MQSWNERTRDAVSTDDPDTHDATRSLSRGRRSPAAVRQFRRRRLGVGATAVMLLTSIGILQSAVSTPAQAAPVSSLSTANLHVRDASDGVTDISPFTYIINLDNTGTTEQRSPSDGCTPDSPGYPDSCGWTSVGVASSSPVVTQGDQSDFQNGGFDLPDGRYLISVLADGYKIDGAHFTMPIDATESVDVFMQPMPLPDTTIQAAVFEDISPVNGAPDLPAEHGLAGLTGTVRDSLGEVTTDVYGTPLCGTGVCLSYCYVVANGEDWGVIEPDGEGRCPSDAPTGPVMWALANHLAAPIGTPNYSSPLPDGSVIEGKIKIPNLGTNRFTLSVTPPDGSSLVQTTTLEGNHDWDSWVMEGATGLDTEFVVGGEPFPAIIFGYAPGGLGAADHGNGAPTGCASACIKGVVDAVKIYVPTVGGTPNNPGQIWGGLGGGKVDKPISKPWVALTDLTNGDTAVWVGQGDANGKFQINNVPDGDYTLTWWDEPQDYILDLQNVTIANGEVVDMGILPISGWWTTYSGYVFNDLNRNGKRDPGEPGVPNYTLTMRRRDNTLMDRGTTVVSTDANGYYFMESAYPMTQWLVMEAYNDLYYTTGVTYQADNQPDPTTVLGAGVDVSVLPIIGLSGTLDWGVHSYDPKGVTNGVDPQNGGIVGTVSYDTTRNELDPRYAAVEDWQPGVSGLTVELSQPVDCLDPLTGDPQLPCDPDETYRLNPDGSYMSGPLLNTYVTETWSKPGADSNVNGDGNCVPRDVDGNPLTYPAGQGITNSPTDCLEAPLMGMQFQQGFSAVDGNYGFGDGCFNGILDATDPSAPTCDGGSFEPLLGASDYLVHVVVPTDEIHGRPLYNFTREEDINIGNGDEFIPQVPPPACVGGLHIVDVAGQGTDGYGPLDVNGDGSVIVPGSTPTENPTFLDLTPPGSPYEGQATPLCDTKLVPLNNGRSIVPTFNVFTDVPVPGRFWGLIVDDLNFSSDRQQINYGEKAGVPFAPIGIYDYTNRLVYTTESDYSGLFDVLMPSTNRINCPTPSGVCGNVYRFVGNDPGAPGNLNANYHPDYRTIAAEFEAIPGVLIPADLAPTQVGVVVQLPGGQAIQVSCPQPSTKPQLFAVSKPYVNGSGSFTIEGQGFGALQGNGNVTLDGTPIGVTSWNDQTIVANVPSTIPFGPHQLLITAANGQTTVNGLTFHVMGSPTPALPNISARDNFNRGNSNNLGSSWSQIVILGLAATRVNNNQAVGILPGTPMWNGTGSNGGSTQGAAITFANAPVNGTLIDTGLILKGNGGTSANPANYIRVVYETGQVHVRITTGLTTTTIGDLPATFVQGDRLSAVVNNLGVVYVWKTSGATTTYLGSVALPTNGSNSFVTGGGRFGMLVPVGARVDDFSGGTVTLVINGSSSYNPNLYEVGPAKTYQTIQSAIDAAVASNGNDLIVVYPNTATVRLNPRGAYYENLIVTTPVKLQGVGPGGIRDTGSNRTVPGSIIDGGAFAGDSVTFDNWYAKIDTLIDPGTGLPTWGGNQTVFDGAVVSIFAPEGGSGRFDANSFNAAIDGFDLRGGDQQGFPGNINAIGGGTTGLPGGLVTQGGAVYANAYARNLRITNNVVQNNGGAYGTIRIGNPDLPAPDTNNHNENVRIANNRIIANAGTNLAGGIGLFAGADNYEVADNDICGNFSAEYGGGITAYGLSPNGLIENNRIWFNRSYDEGGGIMIAGALPSNPNNASPGSGAVTIRGNVIQANMSNDDGGGLRFLMAGTQTMDVYNNMIVNNVSTHEGGGVALNDTTNVRFYNNTVMKNITTATALTSNGSPAPAGLSTSRNSVQLGGSFSNPLLFNNIFWDNRAGTRSLDQVSGIGAGGPSDVDVWDLGSIDGAGPLTPTNSVISQLSTGTRNYTDSANYHTDPNVVAPYDTQVTFNGWRTNPNFIGAILVSLDLPPELLGDYHIQSPSSAINNAANIKSPATAPGTDIDGQTRPADGKDIGADEIPSATPVFPGTAVLDNFNRPNSSNPNANQPGQPWVGSNLGYRINTNTLEIRSNATAPKLWATLFGADQEAYFTFTDVSQLASAQGLVLEASGSSMVRVHYRRATGDVVVQTVSGATVTQVGVPIAVSFANGDTLGARVSGGTLTVYRNGASIGTRAVTGTANSQIGIYFVGTTNTSAGNARIDNFGGGTLP